MSNRNVLVRKRSRVKLQKEHQQSPHHDYRSVNEQQVEDITLDLFYKPHTLSLLAILLVWATPRTFENSVQKTSIGRSTLCGVYTIKYGCRDERVLWRGRHYFDFDRAPLFDTLSQLHLHATAPGTMAHGLWCLVVLLFRACLYAFSKYGTGTFDNLMIILTSLSLFNTF